MMKTTILFLSIILFYSCHEYNTPNYIYPEKKVKLFLIAGQSNAQPLGIADEIPYNYLKDTDLWYYFNPSVGLNSLSPGFNTCFGENCNKAGVEVGIGKKLHDKYQEPILIFNYSKGHSPLVQNDDIKDWSVHSNGEYFDRLKRNFEDLKKYCINCTFDIIGFTWIQGEKDLQLSNNAEDYLFELKDLVRDLRLHLDQDFPVSIVQINIQHPSSEYKKEQLRRVQNLFVTEDGNAHLINVDDIDLDPDNIPHYLMKGYLEIGNRIGSRH